MKKGIMKTPVGQMAQRLPGVGRKRSGLARITGNLPTGKLPTGKLPGGRAMGTAGGVIVGTGAAMAAGRAISKRRKGEDESGESGTESAKGAVGRAKEATEKAAGKASDAVTSAGKDEGGKGGGKATKQAKATVISEQADIGAPRRLVYDQWTRFQEFPSFMKKVESVDQTEEGKLTWKAKIFWSTRTWESTIIEQVPDQHIIWRSKGPKGWVDGTVSFHELAPDLTRVLLVLEYHPQGFFEHTGNMWRAQGRRARLEFKHFVRHLMTQSLHHADEVEGWRGEIRDSQVVKKHEDAVAEEEKSGNGRKKAAADTSNSANKQRVS